MANSLYPMFIKLKYTGATLTHFKTIPVEPDGTPSVGVTPSLLPRSGSPITMGTFIDAFILVLKAEVPNTVTFIDAEAWYYPSVGADPIWIYTHPIAVVGTNATATDQLKQRVISFRTSQGGSGFDYLLQIPTNVAVNARQNFPSSSTPANNTLAYLISNACCVKGRDGGYPVAGNWYTTKYNDAARKKLLDL